MKIKILFIESSKDFSKKDKTLIRNILRKHFKKAAKTLPFKQDILTFTVYPFLRDGISAFTKTKDWIRIMINPDQLKKVGKFKWNKESDDDSWLYGDKEKPRLLGYKIGRYIIQKTLEKNPQLNSVKLIKLDAEAILKLSGLKI